MNRLVLDTNTVVSGFLWSGSPARVVQACLEGKFQPIASEHMLDELADVLRREKFEPRLKKRMLSPESILRTYTQSVLLVEPKRLVVLFWRTRTMMFLSHVL